MPDRTIFALTLTVTGPAGMRPDDVAAWARWRLSGGDVDPAVAELLDEQGHVACLYVAAAREETEGM